MDPTTHNLKSFAETIGLSPSTVSRVLNGHGDRYRISKKTQERVIKAAEQSGIVVNQVARGLRLQTTFTLGLVIPDISNPFFASLARQVERSARERGYSVILADSQESTEVEVDSLRLMQSRRVDGLVIAPVGQRYTHLEALSKSGLPMVLVDRVFDQIHAPSVCSANRQGAIDAVTELASQGHKRIACIQGLPESSANSERVAGYLDGLKQAGLEQPSEYVAGDDYLSDSGKEAITKLMSLKEPPTAVLALGNMLALGAMHALREKGLRVPNDLSIITFDDQPWSDLIDPPLTTIAQDNEELGDTAVELLFKEMENTAETPEHRTLPTSLIRRGSVSRI